MSIYQILVLRSLGLTDQLVTKLAMRSTERSFAAGEIIAQKGASGITLCNVLDGLVSASLPGKNSESDEFSPVDIYGQGNWLGELSLFDHHPSALEYTCLAPTRLLMISHQDAKDAYASEPRFVKYIGNLVAWRSQRHSEMLSLIRVGNPALRVTLGLALLAESIHRGSPAPNHAPDVLEIPLKQSLLASICGVSRGVFSDQIKPLVAHGWLSVNYATTTLHNLPGWHNISRVHRETRFINTKPSMADLLAAMCNKA